MTQILQTEILEILHGIPRLPGCDLVGIQDFPGRIVDKNGIRCMVKEHVIPQLGLDKVILDLFFIGDVDGRTDDTR